MQESTAAAQHGPAQPRLAGPGRLAGTYVTFELAGEAYGVEIASVREFDGVREILPVPRAPDFVRGVIPVRDGLVPVVDLGVKLGLPGAGLADEGVVVVLRCRPGAPAVTLGVLVDRVLGVVALGADAIEPAPTLHEGAAGGEFLVGTGRLARRLVFLLDAAALASGDLPTAGAGGSDAIFRGSTDNGLPGRELACHRDPWSPPPSPGRRGDGAGRRPPRAAGAGAEARASAPAPGAPARRAGC